MNKSIILSGDTLTVVMNGEIYIKHKTTKEFIQVVQECTTFEELRELLMEPKKDEPGEEKKVDKSEFEKFIEQEYKKVESTWKKSAKDYYLYEDRETGVTKLAKSILVNSQWFKEKDNRIIGNLYELYNNRLNIVLKERVQEIS